MNGARVPGYFSKALRGLCCLALLVVAPVSAGTAEAPGVHAIASAHPAATAAGFEVLDAGGNAFDAAVAVAAALAVVEPWGSGLGGGGFFLVQRGGEDHAVMLDARERAPLAAHRDMYLDDAGSPVSGLSVDGPLAAGIPGLPAALDHLAREYGELPLQRSLFPALRLARDGYQVTAHQQRMTEFRFDALSRSDAAAEVFLTDSGSPEPGAVIRQPDLALTLEALAKHGREGFYAGSVADLLIEGVREAGGIWTLEDLQQYSVVERPALSATIDGLTLTAATLPSSGGVVLIEILNMLSSDSLANMDPVARLHYLVEAMRRAYRDRAQYLGDMDYVDVPLERLLSPAHARGLRADIRPDGATDSDSLPAVMSQPRGQGSDTTHFSILDAAGNRVAATLSINYPFGSGFIAPGTGVLLNDEMDDFSIRPGTPNVYGLVGAEANAIAPGKRMLSSMTPSFVDYDDRLMIMGTPGGSRIITMLLLAVLDFREGGDVGAIVAAPRFHHQYLPDRIEYEPGSLSGDYVLDLNELGHEMKEHSRAWGNMQAIIWNRAGGNVEAASDPRGEGLALVREPR